MLGSSSNFPPSTTTTTATITGGGGNGGAEGAAGGDQDHEAAGMRMIDEFGERVGGGGAGALGNRWPREETLALLKIRSDMDAVFRDSSLKGPLWDEVSRKMADLGYHRSAKKCKEKFENVYKYHKRTKDGRATKSDGKTYRFFDQLEAFETSPSLHPQLPALPPPPPPPVMPMPISTDTNILQPVTVPLTTGATTASSVMTGVVQPVNAIAPPPTLQNMIPQFQQGLGFPRSPSMTPSSSSSTSSDDEILGMGRKRKRKWKEFFERLMKKVIDKQEELQRKFLEAIEKRDQDRLVREEAWKVQELARLNREHEILVQERSMAASKDAALIAYLQKLSDHQPGQQLPIPVLPLHSAPPRQSNDVARQHSPANPAPLTSIPQPLAQTQAQPLQPQETSVSAPVAPKQSKSTVHSQQLALTTSADTLKRLSTEGDNVVLPPSPSRWPKAEIEALINLRTDLEQKYQGTGPKGPLWEEISALMRRIGYNRNAKRCKEKWENINKYFKKVKESNKKRPEDSKTCPYFHQLDAIYREKNILRIENTPSTSYPIKSGSSEAGAIAVTPIMARPEQQWPLPEDPGSGDPNQDEDPEDEDDDEDDDQGYEFVATSNAAGAGSLGGGGSAAPASMDNT
ncbi:Trihelix transcription factor GT-2-like protein [Drosera capensis]